MESSRQPLMARGRGQAIVIMVTGKQPSETCTTKHRCFLAHQVPERLGENRLTERLECGVDNFFLNKIFHLDRGAAFEFRMLVNGQPESTSLPMILNLPTVSTLIFPPVLEYVRKVLPRERISLNVAVMRE